MYAPASFSASFQSTPSVWRETHCRKCCRRSNNDFNPLPPCGGRPMQPIRKRAIYYFNPLPPCGGRPVSRRKTPNRRNFNPLPPCGGRHLCGTVCIYAANFNPLPPCGGRLRRLSVSFPDHNISIHSLRVEGDFDDCLFLSQIIIFQSTPSVWRETKPPLRQRMTVKISIHSLRVEGDAKIPRQKQLRAQFQSTPSVWRETSDSFQTFIQNIFQSTPSVWRETCSSRSSRCKSSNFNPLPPCGGRLLHY